MIYAGIDLHADNMVIVATGSNRKVVQEAKFEAGTGGFFSLIR